MSYEDFYYEDVDLLYAYIKAYQEDAQYKGWINGYFSNVAYSVALANAFREKGKPYIEYPEYRYSLEKREHAQQKPKNNNDYEYLSMFY